MKNNKTEKLLENINEYLNKINLFQHMSALISYDAETVCPTKSIEQNNKDLVYLSGEVSKIFKDKNFISSVTSLYKIKDELPLRKKVLIEHLNKIILDEKNITTKKREEFDTILTNGYLSWLKAKQANSYSLFKDTLKKIVRVTKEEIELSARPLETTLFNRIMENNEPKMTTELLDPFFEQIKSTLIPLLKEIKNSKVKIRNDFTTREVSEEKQLKFAKYLLETIGYDISRGAIGQTEHPFTTSISKDDHRVTTHIFKNNFLSNIYSIIHEGGHAIFGQNIPEEDHTEINFSDGFRTLAMDESTSRFFENMIGRSKEFIHLIYPKFKEIFAEEMSDVTEEELYLAANEIKPNLIRTEADELTYSLHIAIRYELEKGLFNNTISFDNLSNEWNRLYKEYLGKTVTSDRDGILQDVHWSSGFGYFPTYSLGNAYNAMYLKQMEKDINVKQLILDNNIKEIVKYMREHIFNISSLYDAPTWIKQITNEEFSAKDYLDYLCNKFKTIYKLK